MVASQRRVWFTVDVEPDCPPYLAGYRGVEEGLARLLALLVERRVTATFFVTGEVARRYPERVRAIVAAGHELGCHGDSHRPFDRMGRAEAAAEIRTAAAALRRFAPVAAFRAPHLRFPAAYYPLLAQNGFRVDASRAAYKRSSPGPYPRPAPRCVATSVTSSVLRLPRPIRFAWLRRLADPVVLFVHPWELVDLRRERLRLDCRFNTGAAARRCIAEVIEFFQRQRAVFCTGRELAA